jgi:septum formation protein
MEIILSHPIMTLPKLYLASQSPRRKELLAQLRIDFSLLTLDVPEIQRLHEDPKDYVLRVAHEKAQAGWIAPQRSLDIPVLGADTAVVIEGKVFGKPNNLQENREMLKVLSGHKHQVLSAVVLQHDKKTASRLSVSTVTFRKISQEEIMAYTNTDEPAGKAGGYAIQGLGATFISWLEGSYSGVMGLPLYETAELLNEFEIQFLK